MRKRSKRGGGGGERRIEHPVPGPGWFETQPTAPELQLSDRAPVRQCMLYGPEIVGRVLARADVIIMGMATLNNSIPFKKKKAVGSGLPNEVTQPLLCSNSTTGVRMAHKIHWGSLN